MNDLEKSLALLQAFMDLGAKDEPTETVDSAIRYLELIRCGDARAVCEELQVDIWVLDDGSEVSVLLWAVQKGFIPVDLIALWFVLRGLEKKIDVELEAHK